MVMVVVMMVMSCLRGLLLLRGTCQTVLMVQVL
jgi:hypothetical protein